MNQKIKKLFSGLFSFLVTLPVINLDSKVQAQKLPKVAIIGNEKSGKTQIFNRLSGKDFNPTYKKTRTVFNFKTVQHNNQAFETYDVPSVILRDYFEYDDTVNGITKHNTHYVVSRLSAVVVCIPAKRGLGAEYDILSILGRLPYYRYIPKNCKFILCVTQCDDTPEINKKAYDRAVKFDYDNPDAVLPTQKFESTVIYTSAKDNTGINELKDELTNIVSKVTLEKTSRNNGTVTNSEKNNVNNNQLLVNTEISAILLSMLYGGYKSVKNNFSPDTPEFVSNTSIAS